MSHPQIHEKFKQSLCRVAESDDEELRLIACEALLQQELQGMYHIGQGVSVSSSFISNAAYQAFVSDRLSNGQHWEPYHWQNSRMPNLTALKPVVGMTPDRAQEFCKWLTERCKDKGESYR